MFWCCCSVFVTGFCCFLLNSFNLCWTSSSLNISSATKNKTKFTFNKDLKLGAVNNDVKELQKYLNANGYVVSKKGAGSKGKETTIFGPATKAALIKFQKAKKINPSNGLLGLSTRKVVNGK